MKNDIYFNRVYGNGLCQDRFVIEDVNKWLFYNDFILLEIYNDFFVCIKFLFIKIFRCIYILIEYYMYVQLVIYIMFRLLINICIIF